MKIQRYLSPVAAFIVAVTSISIGANAAGGAELLSPNSVGGIKLGMTVAEAQAAMPGAKFNRTSDGEGVALISVSVDGELQLYLYAGEEDPEAAVKGDAVIDFIEVRGTDFKTAEGVKVGMKVADIEAKYGKVTGAFVSEMEARWYVAFADQPSGLTFRMGENSGDIGGYEESVASAQKVSPDATILSIEVTGADITMDGAIGGVSLGMQADVLLTIAKEGGLGEPVKGEDVVWEAIGEAVQTWDFKSSGLDVAMSSYEIGGEKSVFSITIEAQSKLKTERGIGIGSSKEDVIKTYADYRSDPVGADYSADMYVVGSIYGGMLFTFEDGKVSRIFLGAAAE